MNRALLMLSALIALCASVQAVTLYSTPRAHRLVSHSAWTPLSRPQADEPTSLSFVLRPRQQDLSAELLSVSDPRSENFGQVWSRAELERSGFGQVDPAVKHQWEQWASSVLSATNGGSAKWDVSGTIMRLTLPAAQMERLLGEELRVYAHATSGQHHVRCGLSSRALLHGEADANGAEPVEPLVPPQLRDSVQYVAGVTRFPPQVHAERNRARARPTLIPLSAFQEEGLQLPEELPPREDVLDSSDSLGSSPGERQALQFVQVAGDDGALTLFARLACRTPMDGSAWLPPTLLDRQRMRFVCMANQKEHDYLGLRLYLSQQNGLKNKTLEYPASRYPYGVWMVDYSAGLQLRVPLPSNYDSYSLRAEFLWRASDGALLQPSFDYPFAVSGLTRVFAGTVTQFYGLDDALAQGVNASIRSSQSMSIAALGLGRPGSYAFFDPRDLEYYYIANRLPRDNVRHLAYVDGSEPPQPNNPREPDTETTLDLATISAPNPGVRTAALRIAVERTDTPFEDLLNLALRDESVHTLSISYGILEDNYAESVPAVNSLFQQLGLVGVSVLVASGDDGAYFPDSNVGRCARFGPSFPASSPWVTAVGGSTLSRSAEGACPTEVACSIEAGSQITTGGGFSQLDEQLQPDYQHEAVEQWLSNSDCPKPDEGWFNSSRRAYPDVSMLAHNYDLYFTGRNTAVDGTSASAPILAGIVARFNLQRMEKGLRPLGFLNPRLYAAHAADPESFNDITSGSNRCMRAGDDGSNGCCAQGFSSCAGWDPVTGLGSPNFPALARFLLSDEADPPPIPAYNSSNNFFPDCANFVRLPPVEWPNDKDPDRTWIPVLVGLGLVCVGALLIYGCMRRYHQRKYGSASLAPAAAGGSDAARAWGSGNRLGAGPADLRAPFAPDPRL